MNSASLESRAHWQRTEGMVIFDEEFRHLFPLLLDSIENAEIAENLGYRSEAFPVLDLVSEASMRTAYIAAHTVSHNAYKNHLGQGELSSNFSAVHYLYNRIASYTHQGPRLALREGVESSVYFPLNLLNHASNDAPQNFELPLFTNLRGISNILRQPWFKNVCRVAALGANGVWEYYSTGICIKISDTLAPYLQLDWQTHEGELQFDLSKDSKKRLHHAMKWQNSKATGIYDKGKGARGTTSGCPVRHVAPRFTSKPVDTQRLEQLASFYGKSVEELTAPRAESGINFGLDTFADFLDRVATLQQDIQSAGKLATSQAASL